MPKRKVAFTEDAGHKGNKSECCCCNLRRQNRVAPVPGTHTGYDMVEICPGRCIRVHHINPVIQQENLSMNDKNNTIQESEQKQFTNHPLETSHGCPTQSKSHRTKTAGPRCSTGYPVSPRKSEHKSPSKSQLFNQDACRPSTRSAEVKTATDVCVDMNPGDDLSVDDAIDLNRPSKQSIFSPAKSLSPKRTSSSDNDKSIVLFFLHGVGGSGDVWQAQIDYFQGLGYELIIPDLLGHGFSSTPKDPKAYHFQQIEKDLLKIFDIYHKKKNAVIGHSYGACFAAAIARQRSRYVHKLVMISGGSPTPLAPQPGVFQWPVPCLACCRPILEQGYNRSAFHGKNKTYIPRQEAFDVPSYVLKYTMNGQDWPEGNEEYHNWISTPTLILHGRHDGLVSISEEQEMAEAIHGSHFVIIEDASHMVMIEEPDVVNDLIHSFLGNSPQHSISVSSDKVQQHTSLYSIQSISNSKLV